MNLLNIRFHPDRGELIFPDIEHEDDVFQLALREVVVVENGVTNTETGKTRPSIVLRLDMPDGKTGIVITTARLLVTLSNTIWAKNPDLMEGL